MADLTPDDSRLWMLEKLHAKDEKLLEITTILSGHSMALKILGIGMSILFTALFTAVASLLLKWS